MTTSASASPHRYLALWFPFLPTDRQRRTAIRQANAGRFAAPDKRLVVLAEKAGNALRLGAMNPAAAQAGLRPGMPLADARAQLPGIVVREMDRAGDALFLARLGEDCIRYTPAVSLSGADGLTLDITGAAHLFGGEAALMGDLAKRLKRSGLSTRSAIASTAEAAQAIARFGASETIAARAGDDTGETAVTRLVGALPVAALQQPAERTAQLVQLGLKTIGDLAARPLRPLAARFGETLIDTLARTLGAKDVPPAPLRPLPACWRERRFAEPIARTDDVEAALYALAGELDGLLEGLGQGGRRFVLTLFRADGATRTLAVETALPTRDPAILLRLFCERIAGLTDPLDPGFGFDLIRLAVSHAEPLAQAQPGLEGRQVSQRVEAAALVDQLCTRLGEQSVQRFQSRNSHVPEAAGAMTSARTSRTGEAPWSPALEDEPPLKPLTLFEPPQPVDWVAHATPDGPPERFVWRHVQYRIARAEGPQRIAPEWWKKLPRPPNKKTASKKQKTATASAAVNDNFAEFGDVRVLTRPAQDDAPRDYYRVEDSDGRRFWLYRQILEPPAERRWFIHGLFP